jgi:hypothetical protein
MVHDIWNSLCMDIAHHLMFDCLVFILNVGQRTVSKDQMVPN